MYRILKAEELTTNIYLMDVEAPRVARSCQPGQFVIVRMDEEGERIPLTICDYNRETGTITIVFQVVGAATEMMRNLKTGDSFRDFVGPLGCPSEFIHEDIENLRKKKILFVAGGLGTAPVYPQVKWMHEHGIDADVIMMKFVCLTTKKYDLPTIVSMNPIMVDGTGMCGACRLTVDGKVKFACVDGPEFDGHKVDFDQAMKRQQIYKTKEGRAFLKAQEGNTHHGGCGQCSDEV